MKYTISEQQEGLHIAVSVPPDARVALLGELAKCAAGTCTCPSTQYENIEAIEVVQGEAGVSIDLRAKVWESIDRADIERCLEHTATLVEP